MDWDFWGKFYVQVCKYHSQKVLKMYKKKFKRIWPFGNRANKILNCITIFFFILFPPSSTFCSVIHKNCWQLAIVKIISFQDSLLTSYDSVVELNAHPQYSKNWKIKKINCIHIIWLNKKNTLFFRLLEHCELFEKSLLEKTKKKLLVCQIGRHPNLTTIYDRVESFSPWTLFLFILKSWEQDRWRHTKDQ